VEWCRNLSPGWRRP